MLKIVLLFVLFFTNFAFGAKAPPSCGAEKRCADGYYCSGAVGDSESGVCVANSVNIMMCRFIDYFDNTIVRLLFIFAAVFAGIYLFLGKMNLNTFATIIVGMSILVGASGLVASVLGDKKGVCGKQEALACLEETQNEAGTTPKNTKNIYNLKPMTISGTDTKYLAAGQSKECKGLGCYRVACGKYKTTTVMLDDGKPICENAPGTDTVMHPAQGVNSFQVIPNECSRGTGANFKVTCTPYVATYARDYFACRSCTGSVFFGEAPTIWNIQNCKQLVMKNAK